MSIGNGIYVEAYGITGMTCYGWVVLWILIIYLEVQLWFLACMGARGIYAMRGTGVSPPE